MNRCPKYRKLVAWLTAGELGVEQKQKLDVHLDECPECRHYQKEMSLLADTIRRAESDSRDCATTAFHRRVMTALESEQSRPAWYGLPAGWVFVRGWRIALSVAVVVLMLIVGVTVLHRPLNTAAVVSNAPRTTDQAEPADSAPTLVNYQMAANHSLERLADLLNRQADTPPPSAPVYTASALSYPLSQD